jgi:hypothetical protein
MNEGTPPSRASPVYSVTHGLGTTQIGVISQPADGSRQTLVTRRSRAIRGT